MNSSSRSVETGICPRPSLGVALLITILLVVLPVPADDQKSPDRTVSAETFYRIDSFGGCNDSTASLANGFDVLGMDTCVETTEALPEQGISVFELGKRLAIVRQCLQDARATILAEELLYNRSADSREVRRVLDDSFEAPEAFIESWQVRNKADQKFLGFNWGVGVGVSHYFDDVISEAVIVNGLVRATKDRTTEPRVVLEFHRYFGCMDDKTNPSRGCGPFVAVTTGQDNVLAGVGAGIIFGWKSPKDDKGSGFSVALGVLLEGDVNSLGDGFVENQPPPEGETEVRYKSTSRPAAILFFTRTF